MAEGSGELAYAPPAQWLVLDSNKDDKEGEEVEGGLDGTAGVIEMASLEIASEPLGIR